MIELRSIVTPTAEEADALYAVVQASPAYYLLVEGRVPDRRTVLDEWFAPNPALMEGGREKWVFGLWHDGKCVGLIDALKGFMVAEQCMIGLMLVAEPHHRSGIGREAMRQFERFAAAHGMRSLRIGVNVDNDRGLAFWRSLGFAETGQRTRVPGALSDVLIFEKALLRQEAA
ncbi:N-acetyltransferase [Oxalobacteraceae bacterium OM1]|nr:N-acetyltransferase [Oxalobacteraceae bacterium OM1]